MEENTIAITRPQSTVSAQSSPQGDIPLQFLEKSKYPTEVVALPSKGWFYPETHPLSSGTIELKMVTAKEEDILTSQNLIKKGIVLQKLISSLIIDKRIKPEDILLCDMNGIFVAIRRLAYGDQYGPLKVKCSSCGEESEQTVDLSKVGIKPFNFDQYQKGQNLFTFDLPFSKRTVGYKILSQKEDEAIETEIKSVAKVNKERSAEITTRLKHMIQTLDGDDDKIEIRKFVDTELISKDSFALRSHIKNNIPDVDMTFDFTCQNCGFDGKLEIPMTVEFFWPRSQ